MYALLRTAAPLAVLAALFAGCGTTQIVASDPQAFISVDGVMVGRGMASVEKTGLPGTVHVVAKTDDGRVAIQPMRREFGWTAGLLGFVTYGVCFFACWQYPDSLYMVLPSPPRLNTPGGWDAPPAQTQDPWLVAPPSWQPATKPTPPATSTPPATPVKTAPPSPP